MPTDPPNTEASARDAALVDARAVLARIFPQLTPEALAARLANDPLKHPVDLWLDVLRLAPGASRR